MKELPDFENGDMEGAEVECSDSELRANIWVQGPQHSRGIERLAC